MSGRIIAKSRFQVEQRFGTVKCFFGPQRARSFRLHKSYAWRTLAAIGGNSEQRSKCFGLKPPESTMSDNPHGIYGT